MDGMVYKGELLEITGASYPTILKAVREGRLAPGRLVGGRVAWLQSEVCAYLDGLPKQRARGASAA